MHNVRTIGICTALIVALSGTSAATAAEGEAGSSAFHVNLDDYRLQLGNTSDYRLSTGEAQGGDSAAAAQLSALASAKLAERPYAAMIEAAARAAALDPALVHAVIYVESGYNANARSPKGALGLMQVMPDTAARYGIANVLKSPAANLQAGTRYLSDLLQMFECRHDLALAAYNAGENAVLRYGSKIPPYAETMAYVPAVLAKYEEWRERPQATTAPAARRAPVQYLPGTRLEAKPTKVLPERRAYLCDTAQIQQAPARNGLVKASSNGDSSGKPKKAKR